MQPGQEPDRRSHIAHSHWWETRQTGDKGLWLGRSAPMFSMHTDLCRQAGAAEDQNLAAAQPAVKPAALSASDSGFRSAHVQHLQVMPCRFCVSTPHTRSCLS